MKTVIRLSGCQTNLRLAGRTCKLLGDVRIILFFRHLITKFSCMALYDILKKESAQKVSFLIKGIWYRGETSSVRLLITYTRENTYINTLSHYKAINAGVPQVSILRPLLLFNHISESLLCVMR